MKKRHLKVIKNRLLHLPSGAGLFKYIGNNIRFMNALRNKSLELPYPNALMLELTNHCQLQCITCAREYSFGAAMDKGNMDLRMLKKIIDDNHIYLDRLGLTGLGEPLIYPHLKEILEYIRQKNKGIAIFLSTNAQLPKTLEILEPIGDYFDTLQISIDGAGEVFEEIRVKANYSSFIENLAKIKELSEKKRFEPKLNMVVFEKNFRQMKDVILVAKEHGIDEVYFNSMNLVSNDWPLANYEFYKSDVFRKELGEAIELAQRSDVGIEYPKFKETVNFSSCPYPWNNFYISWDGFLVPCCAKPFPKEENFGNVFSSGLLQCINDPKFKEYRRMSIEGKAPRFCERCHYIHGTM